MNEGEVSENLKEIKLSMAGYNEDEKTCRDVKHYKRNL